MVLRKRYNHDGKPIFFLNDLQKNAKESIGKKIKSKEYKFETVKKCAICGKKHFETLSEKDRYGLKINTQICKSCGLVFTNPRFNKKTLSKFYDEEYRSLYSGGKTPSKIFWSEQVKHGRDIFRILSKFKKMENKSVIEIGTGAGGILKNFQEKGNSILGIDLGSEYLDFGRKKGLTLFKGDINYLIKKGIKSDIIIYSHVLEHVSDLKGELRKIKKILNPGGLLYIEVPGIKNLEKSCGMDFLSMLQNAHLYYFTLNTLRNLLETNGFSCIYGNEEIKSVFKINKESSKRIENDYFKTINYLNFIENKKKKIAPNFYMIKLKIKKILFIMLKKLNLYKPVFSIYFKLKWRYK